MSGKPAKTTLVYWDACLFIDLLNKTAGRIEVLEKLWAELHEKSRAVVAVTSLVTIAEVVRTEVEKSQGKLDPAILSRINAFWAPESPVERVEVFQRLVEEARELQRQSVEWNKKLRPMDAIHFATAQRRNCRRFLTYDKELLALDGKFPFSVQAPRTDQLPLKLKVVGGGP